MSTAAAPALPRLLTIEDLCEVFQVDRSTYFRWRSEGRALPPSIKIGRRVLYRACDVEAFLEKQVGLGDL